ncbi:MAG: D-aminoacyl-tRNA deacylase [Halorubrum sp.]|uniref:D-aminoacyl-tRNA deacylase n=1 Tax=Halorubrum sp. TaxID=1879286 RepID=UPI003970B010
MIAIVVSRADSASEHIGERLLAVGDWERHEDRVRPDAAGGGTYYRTDRFELREFDDLHIELDDPAAAFGSGADDASGADDQSDANDASGADDAGDASGANDESDADAEPDFLVFVSRHAGETGRLLTAHVTGNFGPAPYGGEPETLANAAPGAEKRVVEALETRAPDGYDVGIECTHHGPTSVSVPSLFVELGSDEPQWADPEGAEAVARAVLDLRGTGADLAGGEAADALDDTADALDDTDAPDEPPRHVVGFGGGHYAPRFTRIVRDTDWAVGHVGADWALGEMGAPEANRETIAQAFERSRADRAVIEGDRPELAAVVADLGHRVVSETWVREVGDRPLALVERLETDLATVDEGLRFGEAVTAEPSGDAVSIRDLPDALLSRAQGVDPGATRDAVAANAVAFDTEQAGSRAVGAAAFPDDPDAPGYADLVDALAEVLAGGYDAVEVRDGAVVASETAFDPALARDRGVPEGPAFGRLADGEAVEVDDETVTPEDVSRSRTDRFPVEIDGDDRGIVSGRDR